jgi:carboxypeptidase Taq
MTPEFYKSEYPEKVMSCGGPASLCYTLAILGVRFSKQTMTKLEQLKIKLAEVCDLNNSASLLGWDQQTFMPHGAGESRAEQLATLGRLSHERFVTPEIEELIEGSALECADFPYESDVASLVRIVRRDYERARKIPPSLVADIARASSLGMEAWVTAREQANFSLFQTALERIFELHRQLSACLGYRDSMYDPLLDHYEPGMTTSLLKELFAEVKQFLIPLVHQVIQKLELVNDSVLHRHYAEKAQWDFGVEVLKRIGFDFERGRLDKSVHPFTTSFSVNDVRITTRIDEDYFPAAFGGTLHEGGHALYEQGVNPSLERTFLAGGASLGVHESQSRLWENIVGRSRGFWKFFHPRLLESFPENLSRLSLDDFFRALNRVKPSFIRIEADELTYNLHILLRYELEVDVLEGRLRVTDLPAAWNSKMKEYLGLVPTNDALGVLQDVHWSNGLIGYFPTYTLGNLISAQIFEKATELQPDILPAIENGEFLPLLQWLRTNIHWHGRKFTSQEILKRTTGESLQPSYYLCYLQKKYAEIYQL